MKPGQNGTVRTIVSTIIEDALYLLTGTGLLYAPAACLILIASVTMALGGEPILAESWALTLGAASCAGAAILSLAQLRHRYWSWPLFLLLTLLATASGTLMLHLANEVIEVSMAQLLFYPAVLLPFHLLRSIFQPAN